ncbi:MAG: SAM-dependent methyltransferase, partial [Myxococcota bacterium]
MTYKSKDRFYKQAKQDRYAARSVYKLEELDRRYGLFKKGQQIVDLGCSPGSWMQFVAEKIGKKGLLL